MYKNVLQSIDNIAVWPVVSFVIFFIFFVVLLLWVVTVDKKFVVHMKNIPLEPGNGKTSSPNSNTL